MTQTQQDLLQLLNASLWQDASKISNHSDFNWKELYKLAKEQCVISIVADTFPWFEKEICPLSEKMNWLGFVIKIEQKNKELNTLIAKLFQHFKKTGLSPVLMKGQAFATNYPVPLHRQCGDIDIYFKHRPECQKAVEWSKTIDKYAANTFENKRERKHFTFSLQNEKIELHYLMCVFENDKFHKHLQEIIDWEFTHQDPLLVNIDGNLIETVPHTLSVLHQLIHIIRHLMEAGIGLRQFCDLAIYLNMYAEVIDKERLIKYLKELELYSISQSIGDLLVSHLGLPITKIPFPIDHSYTDFILNEIFTGGNFGKKRVEYRKHSSSFIRKINSILYFYRRYRLYKPILPTESKSYFLKKIKLNFKFLIQIHY